MILSLFYGALSGLALGLTGGGGSVIAVPLLIYGLHASPHNAIFISLVSVFIAAVIAVLLRLKQKTVYFYVALIMIVGGFVGTPIGTAINRAISNQWLTLSFAVLMLVVGFNMAFRRVKRHNKTSQQSINIIALLIAGIVVGVLTGLFGVGGGFLIVPALVLLANLEMPVAIATSLLIITVTCLVSIVLHVWQGQLPDLNQIWPFALGSTLGVVLGTYVSSFLTPKVLRRGFAVVIVLLGLFMLLKL